MKKVLVALLSVLMALLVTCAWAEEAAEPTVYTSGDYQYVLLEDGTAEISRYSGRDKELTIPATIDGYVVTAIGFEAFSGRYSLTSVTIPDTVTIIGANPFARCSKLTDIIVSPDHPTLATIDGVLFDKMEKKLICYPYAFKNTSYAIPQGIRIIGDSAFINCYNLEDVTLPDSVTTIGDYAFYDCWNLRDVTLPDSVTTIGNFAFTGSGLTSIEIPDSVTTIVGNPFALCNSLTDIAVSPDNPTLAAIDGVLFDKAEKKLIRYPAACKRDSYAIPQGIRMIGDYAFLNCDFLTSITIPDSVTFIGEGAFAECTSLTSITIPDSVTSMGDYVFYCCTSLTSVTLPGSVTTIGYSMFAECTSLTSVTIPDSVTVIGNEAFFGTSLTSMTIPDSVTTIGDAAFRSCHSLTSLIIPDSVMTIGNGAFAGCESLTSVTIPDGVTTIGEMAFYDCFALTSVTLPASVTAIGSDAFGVDPDCAYMGLDALTTFTVPRDSWAAQWCKDNGLRYTYPDSLDWLLN